jgi:endonuclease-3 related protein
MVGAILTQNTNWKNVEKAIASLEQNGLLSPNRMFESERGHLAETIRSSGYYNQKAKKLGELLAWFRRYGFSERRVVDLFQGRECDLRKELLAIHGIGPETADSILCYAFDLPFFVVDAYTLRWYSRYAGTDDPLRYDDMQRMVVAEFERSFPERELVGHYNEFHALIVRLSYDTCTKRKTRCEVCPLARRCRHALTG